MARFYDPQIFAQQQITRLCDNAAHHAQRVLRMQAGDSLTLFNNQGGEWQATIERIDGQGVWVCPTTYDANERTPSLAIHLWLPLIKGERLDWALQKATEMGVASIQLYTSERTEVRLKKERLEKKQRQWEHLLIAACEQCGLNRLPKLAAPIALSQLWQQAHTSKRLIALPATGHAAAITKADTAVTLLTGPEGGFADSERDAAQQHGFLSFTLGERVLRAETAPVALMAALYALTI